MKTDSVEPGIALCLHYSDFGQFPIMMSLAVPSCPTPVTTSHQKDSGQCVSQSSLHVSNRPPGWAGTGRDGWQQ